MNSNRFLSIVSLLLLFIPECIYAQLSAPRPEAVYGGRIRAITAIPLAADSSRVYIVTESANSVFSADVYVPSSGAPVIEPFEVMPALSDSAGFGSNLERIAVHSASRTCWFLKNNQLYRVNAAGTHIDQITGPGTTGLLIHEDHLLYIAGEVLHISTLDAAGNITPDPLSPIGISSMPLPRPTIHIHPFTDEIYIAQLGPSPVLLRISEPYHSLTTGFTVEDETPAVFPAAIPWSVFGIAPDGKLCFGGSDVITKQLLVRVHPDSAWRAYNTGQFGAAGANLAFVGDSANYRMFFGSGYSTDKGEIGTWRSIGTPGGMQTAPNDGPVAVDPVYEGLIYLTSDMGIAASDNGGARIYEINHGVRAVQVKDFAMTLDKQTAWLASKSGIRKVSDYLGTPVWSRAIFPNGDGSPYYAVDMAGQDTNTVYVGNVRVYKTYDGGSSWQQVFNATAAPYGFPAFATPSTGASWVTAIEVCDFDTSLVMVGYQVERSQSGGLFVSTDAGTSWKQILLESGVKGFDVDVHDILFAEEGGDTVAYVGAEYDPSLPTGRSVYRLQKNGSNWIVQQDMGPTGTATGSVIVASIRDLDASATSDTLFAVGTDAGSNHPVAYYKDLSGSAVWTPFPTSGFPMVPGAVGKAITQGIDTVYVAVDNQVFFHEPGSGGWQLGYEYPVGTEINFLFYDELLVGTSTGLYGHAGLSSGGSNPTTIGDQTLRIGLYPNPAEQQVTIDLPEALALYSVEIYSVSGQALHREQVMGDHTVVDVSQWLPGVYLVRLTGQGQQYSGQLLVR